MVERCYGIIPVKMSGLEPHFVIVRHRDGHWGFPKGHSNDGELAQATAKRELIEETGIRDCRLHDQMTFHEKYQFRRDEAQIFKEVTYWIGFSDSEGLKPQTDDVQSARWVTFGEGLDILTFQTAKDTLTAAHQYIKTHDQNQWI